MRLTLTLPELEAGESLQVGPANRINEIGHAAERHDPVAIVPITCHDQRVIAAVLLTGGNYSLGATHVTIKFKPIWCRTYTLCSVKKDTLLALIFEFESGKYWVDYSGAKKTDLTTTGPGCDPKIVEHAEIVLGDMLASSEPVSHVLHSAIQFIKGRPFE